MVAGAGRGRRRRFGHEDVDHLLGRLVDPEVGLCAQESWFTEAQVLQHIAAFGAGQLTSTQIQRLAHAFLHSSSVVRLMDGDPSGRTPPHWSTRAHRDMEDRAVGHVSALRHRRVASVGRTTLEETLVDYPQLGADQVKAVRVLAGPGGALRALIAPAGHGKTTALVAAADAARRSGLHVTAVATTNQAVGELRRAGLDASTVARFALDGCAFPADSVLIVDEVSQLPTAEADIVLSAVASCDGAQVWLVGDPLQSQSVRPGGLASHVAELAERGRIPSATLTVNRRQQREVERQALAQYRDGDIAGSQRLRGAASLEHHADNPEAAREAMAHAVVDAISRHGLANVTALAVTHADCEDMADRVRDLLAQQGLIKGPAVQGPGWSSPRCYQVGDRILLHTHVDFDDGRLANGTVASVVSARSGSLTVRADGDEHTVSIPTEVVAGQRPDGRPRISHAWCRTVDGVQGGTWSEAHLLATVALDRYRGYVGQSRATLATHTWNTRAADPGDHGGGLVNQADSPGEEVLAAMERQPAKTFAAFDDPYRLAERLERERDAHHKVLAHRPLDGTAQLKDARDALHRAQPALQEAERQVAGRQDELNNHGGLSRLRRGRRRERAGTEENMRTDEQGLGDCQKRVEQCRNQLATSESQQQAHRDFDQTEGWRRYRVAELDNQLEQHWTDVVLAATRAGDPYAYGADRLEQAWRTLLHRSRTAPHNNAVEHDLADLERAVLTPRPLPRVEPTVVRNRDAAARQQAEWSELGRDHQLEPDRGRDLGIGL
jgi:hypothetical protein